VKGKAEERNIAQKNMKVENKDMLEHSLYFKHFKALKLNIPITYHKIAMLLFSYIQKIKIKPSPILSCSIKPLL